MTVEKRKTKETMPLREFKLFRDHGRQFIPDLRKAVPPGPFRGLPVLSDDITPAETERVIRLCPAGAIGSSPDPVTRQERCTLDMGRCLFCGECAFALPGKIRFSRDPVMAANTREGLVVRAGQPAHQAVDPRSIRPGIRKLFRHALKLRQVSAGGDNSAEMELNAAGNVNFDMGRFGIEFVASPRHADGIVITGPVSANMAEALRLTYEAVPDPKLIILAGTDAISGGLFLPGQALDRRFTDQFPVDLFVPGNPPHPLTFILGLLEMTGAG